MQSTQASQTFAPRYINIQYQHIKAKPQRLGGVAKKGAVTRVPNEGLLVRKKTNGRTE